MTRLALYLRHAAAGVLATALLGAVPMHAQAQWWDDDTAYEDDLGYDRGLGYDREQTAGIGEDDEVFGDSDGIFDDDREDQYASDYYDGGRNNYNDNYYDEDFNDDDWFDWF